MCSLITSYDDVLKPGLVTDFCEVLIGECKAAFDIKSLNNDKNASSDSYSVGSTYFIRAHEIPTCNLERLVKEIYGFHTDGIECDVSSSGAEWWTQVIDSRDDIGFHWDRDYELEESEGLHVYPIKSTVTYLTDFGAPTIVVDKRGTADTSHELIGTADKFSLCKPKVGRSIVFDGSLLHAAPSGIEDEDDEDSGESDTDNGNEEEEETNDEDEDCIVQWRVTLLVNVWINHIPYQARRYKQPSPMLLSATNTTRPIPEDLLQLCWKRLTDGHEESSGVDLELSSSSCSRIKRWKFTSSGANYKIEVPLPSMNQLNGRLMERGTLTVRYRCGVEERSSIDGTAEEHKGYSNDKKIRILYSKHQPVDYSEDEDDNDDGDEDDDKTEDDDYEVGDESGEDDEAAKEESKLKKTRY